MKIGFYSLFGDQLENRMFTNPNVLSGAGDDLLLPFIRLKEKAKEKGIECFTVDMCDRSEFSAFVFCEMPNINNEYLVYAKKKGVPVYLLIFENLFIWEANADYARYKEFDVVFTYEDSAVDHQHIFKINYSFDLPREIDTSTKDKKKFATMICSNQKYDKKNILYKKRRDTIQWFEDHAPDKFDLYGLGWGNGTFSFQNNPSLQRTLRKCGVLRFFPRRKYPSWKGAVERKRDVLGQYRFGFCYENTTLIPGYITEKIFDVMMAGSVPVYLGAENICDHIPADCFINRAHFSDHESLYRYLSNMSEPEYCSYLKRINHFLSTDQSAEFSIQTFVHTILTILSKEKRTLQL